MHMQGVAALVVSPLILVLLAAVERRGFLRSQRRRLAAAAATTLKGVNPISAPSPDSTTVARLRGSPAFWGRRRSYRHGQ